MFNISIFHFLSPWDNFFPLETQLAFQKPIPTKIIMQDRWIIWLQNKIIGSFVLQLDYEKRRKEKETQTLYTTWDSKA